MDTLTRAERSERMSRIRASGSKVEMAVRRLAHSLGYRYRLHVRGLPGKPDLAFLGRRKVVFVHGCFWHRHACKLGRLPKSRLEFWLPKLERNQERDSQVESELRAAGWDVLVVWECQVRDDLGAVGTRLRAFLGPPGRIEGKARKC